MRLKELREAAGMTQRQLSEKSGVNVRMIQHYEQGFKRLEKANVTTVLRLANALECTPKDLINFKKED